MIGENFEEDETERASEMIERQSLLPVDAEGKVSLRDIRTKLNEARHIRIRRTETEMMMRQTHTPTMQKMEIENPIFRATIALDKSPVIQTKSRKAIVKEV